MPIYWHDKGKFNSYHMVMFRFLRKISRHTFSALLTYCTIALPTCSHASHTQRFIPKDHLLEIKNCSDAVKAFEMNNYKAAFESASAKLCPKIRLMARWMQLRAGQGHHKDELSLENYVSFLKTVQRMPYEHEVRKVAESYILPVTPWDQIAFILKGGIPRSKPGIDVVLTHPDRHNLNDKQLLALWNAALLSVKEGVDHEAEVIRILKKKRYKLKARDYLDRFFVLHSASLKKANAFLDRSQAQLPADVYHSLKKILQIQGSKQVTVDQIVRTYSELPMVLKRRLEVKKWYLSTLVKYEIDMRPLFREHQSLFQDHIKSLWRYVHISARDALITKAYQRALDTLLIFDVKGVSQKVEKLFLSGMLYFQFLQSPEQALDAFETGVRLAGHPQTISKFRYWAGLVANKIGQKDRAEKHFRVAAKYAQTYYGQKAFQELQIPFQTSFMNTPVDSKDYTRIAQSRNVQFALLAQDLKRPDLIAPFLYLGFRRLATKSEKNVLVELCHNHLPGMTYDMARLWGVLSFDKRTYRTLSAVPSGELSPLVHAIIRKESGFFEAAISHAGACGLMQVMPGTALKVLDQQKTESALREIAQRLRSDPALNVSIGMRYVEKELERFAGYKPLMLAGYNAGPLNAEKWIGRYGDPRDNKTDVSVWIELLPFEETREYVKRVLANEYVYQHLNSQ